MRLWLLPGVIVVGTIGLGCGHPATVEECELIVERIVELELKQRNRGSPSVVRTEADKTKDAVRESTMSQCVGKRITKAAMDCVRGAKSSREVVDDCFDGWR